MGAKPGVGTQQSARRIALILQPRALLGAFRKLVNTRACWPVVVGVCVFSLAAAALSWAAHDKPMLRLELAFSKNACCSMQIWVNGTTRRSITILPIYPGRQAPYFVPVWSPHVAFVRMPLGEVPESSVVVKSISVLRGSKVVSRADLSKLHGIATSQARARVTGVGLTVASRGRHPFVAIPVSLATHESSPRLFFARLTTEPVGVIVALLVVGALLAVPFGLVSRREAISVAAIVLTLIAVRALVPILWRIPLHDDVSRAVSQSSYQGIPKRRELLMLELTGLVALAIPAFVFLLARPRRADGVSERVKETGPAGRPLARRISFTLLGLPILLVALSSAPNLRALVGAGRTLEYVPSWDSNNLTFWRYLIQKAHFAPTKDFFWPYGYQWLFDLRVPWGEVWSYLGYLSFWGFLVVGTYLAMARFFAGRALVLRYLLVTSFWLSVVLSGELIFTTRYIAPVAILLLYAALDVRAPFVSARRLLFAFAFFELILFEIAQAAYALLGILFLIVVELALEVRRTRSDVLRWAARSIGTIGVPLAAAALVLGLVGELGGNVDYYSQLGALGAAYAWPSPVDSWVSHPADLAAGIYWAVPVSIALGACGLFAQRGRLRLAHAIVIALGIVGLMVMQKQVLRPPVETQIWPAPVAGIVFWAAVETSLAGLRRSAAIGAVAGVIGAVILASGGYSKAWRDVTTGPHRLADSVGALIHQQDAFAEDARAQFTPQRFANFDEYKPVVRALREDPAVRAGGHVWILGDDSPITMMLGHSWPYYFNDFYDASPIAFQQKVIRQLERTPPVRAVWNFGPDAMVFDTVPNVVRSPLLFEWALRHLAPRKRIGHFEILRPLHEGEHVDLAWWRRRIGSTVDLGHIPEVASLGGGECDSASDCATYIVADFPKGGPHSDSVRIPVTVAGMRFVVEFDTSSASHFVVPLDRLWFWAAEPTAERSVDTTEPGITVVRRRRRSDLLY